MPENPLPIHRKIYAGIRHLVAQAKEYSSGFLMLVGLAPLAYSDPSLAGYTLLAFAAWHLLASAEKGMKKTFGEILNSLMRWAIAGLRTFGPLALFKGDTWKKNLAIGTLLFSLGSVALIWPMQIRSFLLDYAYGTTLFPLKTHRASIKKHASYVFKDLQHIDLMQANSTISIDDEETLEHLIDPARQRLLVLSGTAGVGKTVICRQLAHQFDSTKFDRVLYLDLKSQIKGIKAGMQIEELLNVANPGAGLDKRYYELLLTTQRCLLVLDGLDEVILRNEKGGRDESLFTHVVQESDRIVQSTSAVVMLASRPEAVFDSSLYTRADFPSSTVISIRPITENKEFFVSRWIEYLQANKKELVLGSADKILPQVMTLLNESPVLSDLALEIDSLNKITETAASLIGREDAPVSEFQRAKAIVDHKFARNAGVHWNRWGQDVQQMKESITKTAFDMTDRGVRSISRNDAMDLYCSGMVTMDPASGEYSFFPSVVQDYLAMKFCRENGVSISINGVSLKAIALFPDQFAAHRQTVQQSFEAHPTRFLSSIRELTAILGVESVNSVIQNMKQEEVLQYLLEQ